jgi:hypothetical protein
MESREIARAKPRRRSRVTSSTICENCYVEKDEMTAQHVRYVQHATRAMFVSSDIRIYEQPRCDGAAYAEGDAPAEEPAAPHNRHRRHCLPRMSGVSPRHPVRRHQVYASSGRYRRHATRYRMSSETAHAPPVTSRSLPFRFDTTPVGCLQRRRCVQQLGKQCVRVCRYRKCSAGAQVQVCGGAGTPTPAPRRCRPLRTA